jgi:hypothetical protein
VLAAVLARGSAIIPGGDRFRGADVVYYGRRTATSGSLYYKMAGHCSASPAALHAFNESSTDGLLSRRVRHPPLPLICAVRLMRPLAAIFSRKLRISAWRCWGI